MQGRTAFDYTTISTYLKCPRLYYYKYVLDRIPKEEPIALSFGQAIHQALADWHLLHNEEKAIQIFVDSFKNSSSIKDDEVRTDEKGIALLNAYFHHFPFIQATYVEKPFAIEMSNGVYKGIIDMLYNQANRFIVMEHKTGRMSPKTASYILNYQMLGYVLGVKTFINNIDNLVVNYICVAKTKIKPQDIFSRISLRIPMYLQTETLDAINRIIGQIRMDQSWIPNYEHCFVYGECPYRDVCLLPQDSRIGYLEDNYKHYVWCAAKEEE